MMMFCINANSPHNLVCILSRAAFFIRLWNWLERNTNNVGFVSRKSAVSIYHVWYIGAIGLICECLIRGRIRELQYLNATRMHLILISRWRDKLCGYATLNTCISHERLCNFAPFFKPLIVYSVADDPTSLADNWWSSADDYVYFSRRYVEISGQTVQFSGRPARFSGRSIQFSRRKTAKT